ncbi:CIC11C00000000462 [Sungouiella intermedia]|uniref:CIC11C00000000462 n=1 Tax=Sungouiella intermedia TaxID=45354 RepID=A0A1L0D4G5_9ASCO|nr:CIC11C00000000462 [[Candida] intermedia]
MSSIPDPAVTSITYLILTFSLDTDKFGNETILEYTKKYLDIGEKTFDYTSAWFGSSDFFKRK